MSDVPRNEILAGMYGTTEENDDYKAMKFYIAKLDPENDAVFQYPKTQWNYDIEVRYNAQPISVNKLDNMMKTISEAAKLLKVYTNHSVRATVVALWSNAGIQSRHIMATSGHRSEQSLVHYNTRPSISQLQHCSEVPSGSLTAESSFPSKRSTAINTHTQIREQIAMTAGTISTSHLGSLFKKLHIQQAHVHITLGSELTQKSCLKPC